MLDISMYPLNASDYVRVYAQIIYILWGSVEHYIFSTGFQTPTRQYVVQIEIT